MSNSFTVNVEDPKEMAHQEAVFAVFERMEADGRGLEAAIADATADFREFIDREGVDGAFRRFAIEEFDAAMEKARRVIQKARDLVALADAV
jgi:hypothetical protein